MWVKLSDDFYDNRKFQQISPLAELLYLRCLEWSCRNLSDGIVPYQTVRRLEPIEGGAPIDPERPNLAAMLLDVSLWHLAAGGYSIHDFFVFNKTRTQILEQREKDLARKRNHGGRNP